MSFTLEDIKHLSKLCAINLSEKEQEKFLKQIDEILKFVSQLNEVDVEGIDPLPHPIEDLVLTPREGVRQFENTKDLFVNVKHPIKDNMIVIKSAIK
jgi:aspartyl-tRNA(Asn)/glutamyl-tRNA(Gln) amidotransferase subunit C